MPCYTPHPVCRSVTATTTPSQLVSSHRALGTEHMGHWALGALGKASAVSSTSLAPFIPISAPTLPSLGFPPPSRRGKHGQCAIQSPALISKPQNTRLACSPSSREPCGALLISPTPQLRQIKGLVATYSHSPLQALLRSPPACPSKSSAHVGARRLFLRLE